MNNTPEINSNQNQETSQEELHVSNAISRNKIIAILLVLLVVIAIIPVIILCVSNKPQESNAELISSQISEKSQSPQSNAITPVVQQNSNHQNNVNNKLTIPFSTLIQTPAINDIAFDNSGTVWLATEKGIYKLENNKLTEYTKGNAKYPFPQAECLAFDGENLFAGSLFGLCKLSKSDRFINVSNDFQLPSEVIWDILWDGGNLWISTPNGVLFKNSSNELAVLNASSTNNGLKSSACSYLSRFDNWLAIIHDEGLSLWNINHQAANPNAWKNINHTQLIVSRPIKTLTFDGRNLWFANPDNVLKITTPAEDFYSKFSPTTIIFNQMHGLPDGLITSMVSHKDSVWVGTTNGLVQIQNNKIKTITTPSGETIKDIRSLATHGDILWIGTNQGVMFTNTAMVE